MISVFPIIVFPGFLQKFLDVIICPIQNTDATRAKSVPVEK